MRFPMILTAPFLAFLVSAAVPRVARDTIQPPTRYNLRTKVVDLERRSGSNKDGLYLVPHHTGAGSAGGVLSSTAPEQWYAYYQDDQQYFSYNKSSSPWPLRILHGSYQMWSPVSISVSTIVNSVQTFSFNTSGLQYDASNNGWLACDWWYSYPELFLLEAGYRSDVYPVSCTRVELHPVAIE